MGKSSSSKKRSRAADEDAIDGAAPEAVAPVAKKSKIDVNGKAEVTKNGVEDTPSKKDKKEKKKDKSDKKEKKEKKDKRKDDDDHNAQVEVNGKEESTPKKEKKEKKDKKKKSKSKDADVAAADNGEDVAMEDVAPVVNGNSDDADAEVNGDSDKKKSKKDKKDKKDKKEKKEKKEKKTKKSSSEPKPDQEDDAADAQEEGDDDAQGESSSKSTRFICFVGNLPFTATLDAVRAHFASIDPSSIRLLTHKEDPTKSRGHAFVEFDRFDHMKTCLEKFHHTEFDDGISPARKINVELT